jgi:uncharacterized domain HDIG
MKTDNSKLCQAAVTKDEGKTPVIMNILPVLAALTAVLVSIICQASVTDIVKLGIYTLILTAVVTFYIRINKEALFRRRFAKTIILLGYLGAICLLLLIPAAEVYSFWMFGGLMVAMLIDNKLGLLLNINLTFMLGIVHNLRPEVLIQIAIICFLMCLLSDALKNMTTVAYAVIIILSCNITLTFAVNNFIFDQVSHYDYLDSLFSILGVLVAAFFISLLYHSVINKGYGEEKEELLVNHNDLLAASGIYEKISEADNDKLSVEESNKVNAEDQNKPILMDKPSAVSAEASMEAGASDSFVDRSEEKISVQELLTEDALEKNDSVICDTSYEILCSLENELLIKLKQFSESIYEHSLQIGELSGRAAKVIKADEMLARAGGLYHEIGRINGKNYIEEGLVLADEYAFPKKLKDILREHNIKYDKPSSVEAAIVMLSDNVVSTIEYINKTGDHRLTPGKVIDNIFQTRLDKGTFDSSGISLMEYKMLKEFFQRELNKTSEKEG